MVGSSNAASGSIYDDPSTAAGGPSGGNYGYDNYSESQWLYNDSQQMQGMAGMPDASAAGADASGANNYGGYANTGNNASYPMPSSNKDEGKLFVGGLNWETDENRLREYFSRYGNIMDCTIMRDPNTGRPRGFGFVTFDSVNGVNAVLQEPTHTLDGKKIDPKHAIPRENQQGQPRSYQNNNNNNNNYSGGGQDMNNGSSGGYNTSRGNANQGVDPVKDMQGDRIFVGGLPPTATEADMSSGFSQFGNVIDTKLIMDKITGRSRNYGFLQFDNDDSALAAVKAGNTDSGVQIHGKRVDVRAARYNKPNPMLLNGGAATGQAGAYGMYGYGMMGMMGMPGYGMMGMPGYGAQGAAGGDGSQQSAEYMAAMGYGGYYGNMAGYYGTGVQGDGSNPDGTSSTGVDGSAAAVGMNGYYDQSNMNMAYYGTGDGQGNDSGYKDNNGGAGSGNKDDNRSGSGNYDKKHNDLHGSSSYSRGGRRHGDDRGRHDRGGRDGGDNSHRSSRRHGDNNNDGGRSGRDRQHGEGSGGGRARDDHRSSRGSRSNRDRDGSTRSTQGSSSRSRGYKPY